MGVDGYTPVLPAKAEREFVETLQRLLQSRLTHQLGIDPHLVKLVDREDTIAIEVEVDDAWQPQVQLVMIQALQDVGVVFGRPA